MCRLQIGDERVFEGTRSKMRYKRLTIYTPIANRDEQEIQTLNDSYHNTHRGELER